MFLQRRLHFEIQAVLLLLTRRAEIALALFSLLFFPGVFLHETSHYVIARLVGVKTGHFSLLPQPLPDGRLRLGYVETASTDLLRDALIGIAPLLAGGAFVIYAGQYQLDLPGLWESIRSTEMGSWTAGISKLYRLPDFWLWFYLVFAVSSTMLPSASDRRAWLPVALFAVLVAGVALFAGAGAWMVGIWPHLAPWFNQALRGLALIFGISSAVHLILLPPCWLLRKSLARLRGLTIAQIGT
jgi:hypothetical protein